MGSEITPGQRDWSERQAHLDRVADEAWRHGVECGKRKAEQAGLCAALDAAEALLSYLCSVEARRPWNLRYIGLHYAYDAVVALAEPARGAQQEPSDG